MKTAEKLLEESVQQYREMLAQTKSVKHTVQRMDTPKMPVLATQIKETQEKVSLIDRELAPYLEQYPELSESILYRDRMTLIEEIYNLSKVLLGKCRGVQDINRNESGKIAKGRVLMSGYHSHLSTKGRLIKIAK